MMKQHISGGLSFPYTTNCRWLTASPTCEAFLSSSQLKIPIPLFNRRATEIHRPSLNMNWMKTIKCPRPLSTRSEHESNSRKSRYDDATRPSSSSDLPCTVGHTRGDISTASISKYRYGRWPCRATQSTDSENNGRNRLVLSVCTTKDLLLGLVSKSSGASEEKSIESWRSATMRTRRSSAIRQWYSFGRKQIDHCWVSYFETTRFSADSRTAGWRRVAWFFDESIQQWISTDGVDELHATFVTIALLFTPSSSIALQSHVAKLSVIFDDHRCERTVRSLMCSYPMPTPPFASTMPLANAHSYNFPPYHSPFIFQDMSNYQRSPEFYNQWCPSHMDSNRP